MDKSGQKKVLDQFLLRNLMVSFVSFRGTSRNSTNRICNNDVINWYDFGDKNSPLGGKNGPIDFNFFTLVDDY